MSLNVKNNDNFFEEFKKTAFKPLPDSEIIMMLDSYIHAVYFYYIIAGIGLLYYYGYLYFGLSIFILLVIKVIFLLSFHCFLYSSIYLIFSYDLSMFNQDFIRKILILIIDLSILTSFFLFLYCLQTTDCLLLFFIIQLFFLLILLLVLLKVDKIDIEDAMLDNIQTYFLRSLICLLILYNYIDFLALFYKYYYSLTDTNHEYPKFIYIFSPIVIKSKVCSGYVIYFLVLTFCVFEFFFKDWFMTEEAIYLRDDIELIDNEFFLNDSYVIADDEEESSTENLESENEPETFANTFLRINYFTFSVLWIIYSFFATSITGVVE